MSGDLRMEVDASAFEGGLRRIKEWHRVIRATGGEQRIDRAEAEMFASASQDAIAGVLEHHGAAACCRFDPMGAEALKSALSSRRNLLRLTRIGPQAKQTAAELSASMLHDLMAHLKLTPFINSV